MVATRYLARAGADVLALLGAGAQAHAHWRVFREDRGWKQVRIWSRTRAHAEALAAEIPGAVVCDSAEDAVRPADVIVCATSATQPVLCGEWLKPGAHVNAVGACRPDRRELDSAAMMSGSVVVDSRAGALVESGDIILANAPVCRCCCWCTR